MNAEELQTYVGKLEADGISKRDVIRTLAQYGNCSIVQVRDIMKTVPEISKRYYSTICDMVHTEKKKHQDAWGMTGENVYEGVPKDYAPSEHYMEDINKVRQYLQKLDEQIEQNDKTIQSLGKINTTLLQEKRNLLATIKQMVEDFGK